MDKNLNIDSETVEDFGSEWNRFQQNIDSEDSIKELIKLIKNNELSNAIENQDSIASHKIFNSIFNDAVECAFPS